MALWIRPFPSSSLLGWGPRGGQEAPKVCPASVSALWVLRGARPGDVGRGFVIGSSLASVPRLVTFLLLPLFCVLLLKIFTYVYIM